VEEKEVGAIDCAIQENHFGRNRMGFPTSDVLESLTELRLDMHPKSSWSLKQKKRIL